MDNNNIIMKNSKVGIASMICMIVAIVVLILGFIFAGMAEASQNEALYAVGGLFIILCLLVALGGIVTGIIGCCMASYKKVLPIIGLTINVCLVLIVVFLMVLGSTM